MCSAAVGLVVTPPTSPGLHAETLQLNLEQGSNLQAVDQLLHMPAGQLSFSELVLTLPEHAHLALLPRISMLRDGRINTLRLHNVRCCDEQPQQHSCTLLAAAAP